MKLIYVAGPFSAKSREGVEKNILRATLLGIEVAKLGACPWIPHANTAHSAFEYVQEYAFWIEATLLQLSKCDAIIMTPDWRNSSGARGEHEFAEKTGMPIFYDVVSLRKWLANAERK